MNSKKLKQIIKKILKVDDRLWNKDKTELNQTLLLDLVEHIDEKVIDLLLQEKELREKFFVKINPPRTAEPSAPQEGNFYYVFKTNDFRFFMEENKVDNSYTAYKNRIGLADGKKFLKDTNDVVLNWPYKDCVLEGGQSTEEGTDTYFEYSEKSEQYEKKQGKRKEIFFNEVLAHDEIDRLFDPKALVNWKRFDKNGELSMVNYELKRREDGTIAENMIIKGNNLLALCSLKKQFAGKVKLIYIDPPYNTGNDGFKYNDNFNHSTWLTFMKNRLEVARELLRDDGSIFVQCDDNEQAYLKVLMDEVFGRENFVGNFIWKKKSGGGNDSKYIVTEHETIISFSKKINSLTEWYELHDEKYLKRYKEEDEYGKYFWDTFARPGLRSPINYDIKTPDGKKMNGDWIWSKKRFLEEIEKGEIKFKKNSNNGWTVFFKQRLNIKGKKTRSLIIEKGNSSVGTNEISKLFHTRIFSTPKPEILLQHLIYIATNKNDIVLDYHLGSATTCAVSHKMGRQYIGIEQMDYIETVAVERLKKVIDGEQGGISKSVNWQGGGEFIYFELAKWNETAKEKILACENLNELIKFFDEMSERYFLNYNLKIKEFREKVIKEEEFKNLSLDEQKKMFIAMLDNNQMYVNKTEMADKKFGIDKKDQKLTSQFYNGEK